MKSESAFSKRQKEAKNCLKVPEIQMSRIGDRIEEVWAVAVEKNNKYFVSSSSRHMYASSHVDIWDVEKKVLLHRFENAHSCQIRSVALAEDSKCIVSGSDDNSIAIWDIEEKKLFHRFEKAHSNRVRSVAVLSRSGENNKSISIVSGSDTWEGDIAIWDVENKKLFHRFEKAHSDSVNSVAIMTGGENNQNKYIVSGSRDKSIAIWDVEEKKLSHRFQDAHSESVNSVAIMTEGENNQSKYIISGSDDKSIAIWDVQGKKLLHRFQDAHSGSVYSVAIMTEGENNQSKYIISGSLDRSIAIWDVEDRKLLHRFENSHSTGVVSVAVTAGGGGGNSKKTYLVSSSLDGSIAIWDVENKKLFHRFERAHSNCVKSVAVMIGGETNKDKYIVSGSWDKSIAIWNVEDQKLFHRFEEAHSDRVNSVAVMTRRGENKKSKYIVSGSNDKSIAIWDVEEKKLSHRFEGAHSDRVNSVAVMIGGGEDKYIASGSNDKSIAIWSVEAQKLLHRFELAHSDDVNSVTVMRGGEDNKNNYLVSGSSDKSIAIWDVEDRKLLHRFENAHSSKINSVAVMIGGGEDKYIASGSDDKSIAMWSIEDKKLLHRFENAHSSEINSVAVMTQNKRKYILSGSNDRSVAIWDVEEKKLLHRFENAHFGGGYSVAVMVGEENNQNRYVVSGSEDMSIVIWDVEDKRLSHRFENAHSDLICSVTIMTGGGKNNNENKYIVSGSKSWSGSIAIWDVEGKKLLHRFEEKTSSVSAVAVMTGTGKSKYIISGAGCFSAWITIWDVEEKSLLYRFEQVHSSFITSLAVMTKGENDKNQYIVSGSRDKSIAIWNVNDKTLLHRFENAHSSFLLSVAVMTRGENNYIVSGSSDKSIAIWDVEDKKLSHRFEDAHSSEVNSVAVMTRGENNYIISGSKDKSIAIWDVEEKKLSHRFEDAHSSDVTSVAVMIVGENNQSIYIVSGSNDKSIAIWDVEEKKLLHRLENSHSSSITSVAVMTEGEKNTYIVSGSIDKSIAIWDVQRPLQSSSFLPHLTSNSRIYSSGCDHPLNHPPKLSEISFLVDLKLLSVRWNFLNFAIFLLPNVRPAEYLNFAINNKIYLSIDGHGKTHLDYLLDFRGDRTPAAYEFFSIFFKEMTRFLNLDYFDRENLLHCLAKLTVKIYKTQASTSLLGYLKCFVRPAEAILDPNDLAKLPNQGELKNGQDQAFIKLKRITVPSSKEYSDIIETVEDDSENNAPTLKYEMVLLPLDYYGNSPATFNILNVFETFEVEDSIFYEDPTVCYLIDFLWEKFKGYLYFQVLFFGTNTVLYTIFGIYYQNEQVSSPILIIVIVMNCLALALEGFGASASLDQFLKDPWNYFETITPIFQIISAILYWTVQGSLSETIFISTSILLLYTKFLITMRVFDQLRHMIRMILEILSDSKGFMVVIFTYAIGLTIAVYHNREVQQDSDGSGIYAFNDVLIEMYAFAIGSWSYTEYAGVNIAFFLFASFLLPLVLLNMLIALMGDTYGRVQDNRQAFDSRERVLMLYELVSASHQFRCLMNWIQGKKLESMEENKESFFLLVVKEFSISEGQVDMKSISDGQKAMEIKLNNRMTELDGKIEEKIGTLKSDLSIKIDNKVGAFENKMRDQIGSLKDDLRKEMAEMRNEISKVSELLIGLGKNPNLPTEKQEEQKLAVASQEDEGQE